MDFEFGDIFYAVVSDRTQKEYVRQTDPNFTIHKGLVLMVTDDSILEGDERYLLDQRDLNHNIQSYHKSICFKTLEEAEEFISAYEEANDLLEDQNETL